ncbi:hypothetical protein [Cellulosimicrobium sp. Marseille-Q4280]|uniref:hypothetical protein n=1 Tax=Cellulosimicrobium sp. Marseille-Q4280 TaxID=2937992 RepID=UPI00333B91F9
MSASAARPVSETVVSARCAAAGSEAAAYRPPSAWAMITDRECATMSCISRAMRARSAEVAIRACWSRSTSSRSARSTSAAMVSRRERRTSPNAHTARNVMPPKADVKKTMVARSARLPERSPSARPRTTAPTSAETIAVRWAQRGP